MYRGRPWTVRQYAGFSTARESNAFYRKCLAEGMQGLSVAFDLPTHRGYDSDHPRARGDVGKAGVAVDSVEDMRALFEGIPLDRVSVSMTMNGAVLPVLAAFVVAAEEQGVPPGGLRGTIQNDILKEFMVRNTYIYPPAPSMGIVADVMAHVAGTMPGFNSISVSGYHLQEAGADPVLELAYALANGREYLEAALGRGLAIDDFAPRMSFFFGVGMDFYVEVAKLRAARLLWHGIVSAHGPKDPRSTALRTHCQTSGHSLAAQDPLNNVVRTTVEAMAAVFGGTQSLHTNAFDEALSLPTEESARVARNTQLILREETGVADVIDPWGGSYMMEALTRDVADRVRAILDDVRERGGMVRLVERGEPKALIERAAALKQARIDGGEDVVVGVNRYRSGAGTGGADVLDVDDEAVRREQSERLRALRGSRDAKAVARALGRLTERARTGEGNALGLAVEAMRARATVGEVSEALERVWGRHRAQSPPVSGIYGAAYNKGMDWRRLQGEVRAFEERTGRRPRMLVAKMGQDGHDRGARVVATAFSDAGFDVDLSPLFSTPGEVAKQALENDVHVVGVSSQAGGHRHLVAELLDRLRETGAAGRVAVVLGGIVPEKDKAFLAERGVRAFFDPGAPVPEAVARVLEVLSGPPGPAPGRGA